MNILLLGSGGRECAIAWKLAQSPECSRLFIAPGNAGSRAYGTNVSLPLTDFGAIKAFCLAEEIGLLFPGGEDTLVAGIWDFFKNDPELQHIIVAGPSKDGAQLEGSKAFSKKFMQRHDIPTAAYHEFDESNFEEGLVYLEQHTTPIVLKADGLAAGKGVVITSDIEEAKSVFAAMIKESRFGDAGKKVVVEQFLTGVEVSVFALSDGRNYVLLPEAKDYKRVGEGDTGPNTGGMGAVSPVPFAQGAFMEKVEERIVKPTVAGLAAEGIVYQGFIFFGLINVDGEPFVIEYNCRMGDPETEVVMPRLENDLVALIRDMDAGRLHEVTVQHSDKAACTVMLVSQGYPDDYAKGKVMSGLETTEGSLLFHAGTTLKEEEVLTSGGRVLAITSYGAGLKEALAQSYLNAEKINFEGKQYRRDIGYEF
ncbi:phosphoribosylamine--glycine ligase [Taibaiella koreensis]|uniref:phosphoribosylamine--glycine ligase n=1 Tax=Taibaiella koreensis TaxID=1268548 RepID=UPI000E59E342|nr:phosphoribosylamine--glycine ligase [Taibaiella koreensis]